MRAEVHALLSINTIPYDEKKGKAVSLQEVCLQKILSLLNGSDKKRRETLSDFRDFVLSIHQVSRFQLLAKERTRAGGFLPIRYAVHKQALLTEILNTSDHSYLQQKPHFFYGIGPFHFKAVQGAQKANSRV